MLKVRVTTICLWGAVLTLVIVLNIYIIIPVGKMLVGFYLPPEKLMAPAPRLTDEDITRVESFLGLDFPSTTKKIWAYCKSVDLCHLYVHAEFASEDIPTFKKGFSWETPSDVDLGRIEVLNSPVKRVFVGAMAGSEDLGWWKPALSGIRWICREKSPRNDAQLLMVLEVEEDVCRVYIVKDVFSSRIPEDIETVFPRKPNWDLRESADYPKRQE